VRERGNEKKKELKFGMICPKESANREKEDFVFPFQQISGLPKGGVEGGERHTPVDLFLAGKTLFGNLYQLLAGRSVRGGGKGGSTRRARLTR